MAITLETAKLLLTTKKTLLVSQGWFSGSDRHSDNKVWKFECRVREGNELPRGLWFRAQAWQRYPKTSTIQLECDHPDGRSHQPLYRLELTPFSPHQNGPKGPQNLVKFFIDAGVSHEHSYLFYDGMDDFELSKSSSPLAAILANAPKNLDKALDHVCDILKIDNRADIPPIPLQMDLV